MFSRFFIYRPVFALVISIIIVILGIISLPTLPVESMPEITPPTVEVSAAFPGASADVVEQAVTSTIEQQVNGVEDMIYMQSQSTSSGTMKLTISFDIGTDVDMAAVLTQNRVAVAEPLLPEEVKRQGVRVEKKSTDLLLMVNLISPDGRHDDIFLSNYATTRIKDMLARVPGVGNVSTMGAKDFGMRIWLDPDLVKSRGLTTEEVMAALREQNVQVAGGKIGQPPNPTGLNFEYNINTQGRLTTVGEFENIIVKAGKGSEFVYLRDIARIELGANDYSWYVQLDGKPSVGLAVYQLPGSNALEVADGIKEVIGTLSAGFPEGMQAEIVYDSTRYIQASIDEVIITLIVAILLVVFTVFLFLQDWRPTLVPAVAIPVSLIGTFFVMKAIGLSINNLTLFGLVLAIGVVVDDAIVVVENARRIIDEKRVSAAEATAQAMSEIGGAVIATTLVLLAVFVPTLMMPGLTGRLYQQFAITISVATLLSSINALTLSPALCGILLRPTPEKQGRIFTRFNRYLNRGTSSYTGLVARILRKAGLSMAVFAGLLLAAWFGITSLPLGFIPEEDKGYFFVDLQLPDGASLERTEATLDRINEWIGEMEGTEGFITIGGYSFLNGVQGSNYGALIVTLRNWRDRGDPKLYAQSLISSLQSRIGEIQEGIAVAFGPPPISGLGAAGGFTMEVQDRGGLGSQQLETLARDLVDAAYRSPRVTRVSQNFSASVPQLYVDVDRSRAKAYGVPLQSIYNTLQANLGAAYVNDFNLFGRTWKVMVQADQEFRSEVEDISKLEVRNEAGEMIPLGSLCDIQRVTGPQVINRFNMFPSATVSGRPSPGYSSGQAMDEMERLAGHTLPSSMGHQWSGVSYQERAAGSAAPFIFTLAVIIVFLFLAAQYESWTTPLSVLLAVPFAILGASALTILRQMDNNVYTQIGLVLLIGLTAKSAILIVEFAKQLREEGRTPFDAALTAAQLRFRPILMTSLSFILGVSPLVIAVGAGAASRQSLGTAVFGGMLIGTIGGLVFVPLLYLVVQTTAERAGGGRREKTVKEAQTAKSAN